MRITIALSILAILFYGCSGQKYCHKNSIGMESANELVIARAGSKYNASSFILYTNNCSNEKKQHIVYTLGTIKSKPVLIKWTFEYLPFNMYNRKLKHKLIKKEKEDLESIQTTFNQYKFWTLSNDSINCSRYWSGGEEYMLMPHGCEDKFILINHNDKIILMGHALEDLQSQIPVNQRQSFIICRGVFLKILE